MKARCPLPSCNPAAFNQALRLGQLAPPPILPDDWRVKLPASLATRRGGRVGDVKLPLLILNSGPEEVAQWLA